MVSQTHTSSWESSEQSLPPLQDLLERAHVATLPMKARFRGIDYREVLVFEGAKNWSEFSPFLEYSPQESVPWLQSAIETGWWGLPEKSVSTVPVNATIPALDTHKNATLIEELLAQYPGVDTVKIKVAEPGQTLLDDLDRVDFIRTLDPSLKIRLDANGAWTVAQAFEAAQEFQAQGPVDYIEQPCARVEELAQLRTQLMSRGIFIRVAADESIRKAEDPYNVIEQRACDVAVLKTAPLGGVSRVMTIAEYVDEQLLGVTLSSALESSIGMGTNLWNAACLGSHEDESGLMTTLPAEGLGTGTLFIEDVTEQRAIIDGKIEVKLLAPDPDRLEGLSSSGARRDWHFKRLAHTYSLLEQQLQSTRQGKA